jgi:hypothetical protein
LQAEAKDKKAKRSASRSQSRSSKRSYAKRGSKGRKRVSNEFSEADLASNHPVVPDNIEVIEYGSASSPEVDRYLDLPRAPSSQNSSGPIPTVTPRPKSIKIEASRVLQIQQALANRGFYSGEMTGVYDAATVEAMRQFQAKEKIHVTGYPTAHALKRLGLGNW